jgi:MYXO-CTERM domain-containing protein
MLPVRFTRVGMVGVIALVCASAGASTITFMLDGPTSAGGTLFSSSATSGGQTYTLAFAATGLGTFQTLSGWGWNLPTFEWTLASISLVAPAGKQLLFTGYRQFSGFNLAAGSTFDFGTSLGNALPSTGSTWPPPPAVDYTAQGAFTMAHGDIVTFTNNAVWGGVNASAWIESFTFQVQSSAVPAPFAASGAATLLALAGPFGRRRRR